MVQGGKADIQAREVDCFPIVGQDRPMKLSKSRLGFFAGLKQRKNREEEGLFLVEGEKSVADVLSSGWEVEALVAGPGWLEENRCPQVPEVFEASSDEMGRLSSFKSPPPVLAVVKIPPPRPGVQPFPSQGLFLGLDDIQDPGNLGTILRIADWFGICEVLCSRQTVDLFNSKTIQASMGSFLRVKTRTVDLVASARDFENQGLPVWGTFLAGESIYAAPLRLQGLLVLGNEGQGISPAVEDLVSHRLTIPSFASGNLKPDSLNVAVAASIVCSEFRRR